jgi:hypothetical protein
MFCFTSSFRNFKLLLTTPYIWATSTSAYSPGHKSYPSGGVWVTRHWFTQLDTLRILLGVEAWANAEFPKFFAPLYNMKNPQCVQLRNYDGVERDANVELQPVSTHHSTHGVAWSDSSR